MTATLPVTEVMTTLQGEGPAAGRPATFIRTGGCNLSCSWCGVPETWDATRFDLREQITRRDVDSILDAVTAPTAVITGGEPLLHQNSEGWRALLRGLTGRSKQIHVETNGTIAPSPRTQALVDLAVVSPKQEHAAADSRTGLDPYQPKALEAFAEMAHRRRAALKVVVQTPEDCRDALTEADLFGWPRTAVWLMPEGTTVDALQARWPMVADFAAEHGINATHRLHVLAQGQREEPLMHEVRGRR